MEVLLEDVLHKNVLDSQGHQVGQFQKMLMDKTNGQMKYLVVKPESRLNPDTKSRFEQDTKGRLLVPVSKVNAVRDHILLS